MPDAKTSIDTERSKVVLALRLALLRGGYVPIPLYGKTPPVYGKNNARKGLALQLFPAAHATLARKKDHGRAEASLIALYGAGS
jgi:hypothetical protein